MLSSGMIHADDIGLHHAAQIFIYDAKHLNDLEYIKIVLRQSQIFSQAVLCAYTDARLTGCTKVNRHAIRLLVVNLQQVLFLSNSYTLLPCSSSSPGTILVISSL